MEAFGIAIAIVAVIAVIILAIILVRLLFTNFMISRVISLACAAAGLICAFIIAGTEGGAPEVPVAYGIAFWTGIFGWCFFIGPVIFDVEWDGTFTIDWDSGEITPGRTGGFIMNFVGTAVVFFIIYGMLGTESAVPFFIPPIGYLIANIATIIYANSY